MKYSQFVVWNLLAGAVYVFSVGLSVYGAGKVVTGHHDAVSVGSLVLGIAVGLAQSPAESFGLASLLTIEPGSAAGAVYYAAVVTVVLGGAPRSRAGAPTEAPSSPASARPRPGSCWSCSPLSPA